MLQQRSYSDLHRSRVRVTPEGWRTSAARCAHLLEVGARDAGHGVSLVLLHLVRLVRLPLLPLDVLLDVLPARVDVRQSTTDAARSDNASQCLCAQVPRKRNQAFTAGP